MKWPIRILPVRRTEPIAELEEFARARDEFVAVCWRDLQRPLLSVLRWVNRRLTPESR
jgi:hypothetical protein